MVINNITRFLLFTDIIRKFFDKDVTTEYQMSQVLKQKVWWPMIQDFTVIHGAEKLQEFINNTSDVEENWTYSIKLLDIIKEKVSDFYKYEAIFSLPTSCHPIPQTTASVFFTYEVSRVKSPVCHVDVTFQLEGTKYIMIPGKHILNDALLFRVLDAKLNVFRQFSF